MTTASKSQQMFIQSLNEAMLQVQSGAFSYQEALKQAIKKAAQSGGKVLYSSGSQMSLDAAMRMALLTGVNQTAASLTELYISHMVFASDGATVAYLSSSSRRYKDHIANMTLEEAEKVLNIPVVWFKYKDGYLDINDPMVGKPVPGMYAEDVFDSFPEATYNNPEGQVENWNERMLIPSMLKLLQELYKERESK